jgi:hypothetical protein
VRALHVVVLELAETSAAIEVIDLSKHRKAGWLAVDEANSLLSEGRASDQCEKCCAEESDGRQ